MGRFRAKQKKYQFVCGVKRSCRIRKKICARCVLLFLAVLFLSLEVQFLTAGRTAGMDSAAGIASEPVLTSELAGYLQIIPFSPEETRAWLLPEMGTYLSGNDVDYILEFLDIAAFGEGLQEKYSYSGEATITRLKWCLIYEEILEYLGLADEVQVITIQYLGMLDSEGRLMADNGDYDCDPDSIEFIYGETYEVYICGNTLLGKYADDGEAVSEAGEAEQENIRSADSIEVSLPEKIRVLLTQDNHASVYRETVRLKGTTLLHIRAESGSESSCEIDANTAVNCAKLMKKWKTTSLIVEPEGEGMVCVTNSEGSAVSSWYTGVFYVYKNTEGMWIVNEVDMEEYLCGVVPGEMPESFEEEALRAQTVCARTYACCLAAKSGYGEYEADLTDSTDCQVYLPSKENEKTSQAVKDTAGQVLSCGGNLANIYYFSTSCGYTCGTEVWQMPETAYLPGISLLTKEYGDEEIDFDTFLRDTDVAAYDSESRYFRWQATADMTEMQGAVKELAAAEIKNGSDKVSMTGSDGKALNDINDLGDYVSMSVEERSRSGTVTDLRIEFTGGYLDVFHENMIRKILGLAMISLTDKNGNSVYTLDMLPSAAISVDCPEGGTCTIYGGGLGHGIGMSQYGANGMAETGMQYDEILASFFPGTEIITMDPQEDKD